jgi:hypothetical protein
MTSPRGKNPHAAVLVAEPVRAPLQRIPGHSHFFAKRNPSAGISNMSGGQRPWLSGNRVPTAGTMMRS